MKRFRFLGVMALILSLALVAGCGGQQAAAPAASSGSSSGPVDKPDFVWRMQVIHNNAQSDFHQNVETANEIFKASNGRMKIEVHPNGTFASSMEAYQACGQGVFEVHSSWPSYLRGTEYAFLPLGTGNLSMEASDKYVWVYEAGGWDLMQKAFDTVNLKLIAVEIWGTEVMMSKKPFDSIMSMKGSKMRTSDPRLLERNGIAAVTMPLEEVFTALSTGAVECVEFGNLDYNKGLGLTDIADYAIWPDFWNCHFVTTVVVNKDAWNKLPPDLQTIVEMAFKAREFQHWTKSQYLSAVTMKELQESDKMKFMRMPTDDFIPLRAQVYEIEKEERSKSALTAELYDSLHEFMEVWYPYKYMARWWGWGMTPEEQLGYTPKK